MPRHIRDAADAAAATAAHADALIADIAAGRLTLSVSLVLPRGEHPLAAALEQLQSGSMTELVRLRLVATDPADYCDGVEK